MKKETQPLKYILIVDACSSGINYIQDIKMRGYKPLVLEVNVDNDFYIKNILLPARKRYISDAVVIKEQSTYQKTLALVKKYHPVAAVVGSETGVELGTRLMNDLHLPSNPYKKIKQYVNKDAMHEALKKAGVRYIRGKVVHNLKEAKAFYQELDVDEVVLKPMHGAGSQGIYFCRSFSEVEKRLKDSIQSCNFFGEKFDGVLMQEKIKGIECYVNTMSRNKKHRIISMWKYSIGETSDGKMIFDNAESVNLLEVSSTRLVQYAFDCLDAIGVENGPAHTEFFIDEKGPVMVEINCRVAGASMPIPFLDRIFGHHDTDQILDDLLYIEHFNYCLEQEYRTYEKGMLKLLIIPKEFTAVNAPVTKIVSHLNSFYSTSVAPIKNMRRIGRTIDLETSGGTVYLVNKDHGLVQRECEFLHLLELYFFNILFQGKGEKIKELVKPYKRSQKEIDEIVNFSRKNGPCILLTDQKLSYDNVKVVDINHTLVNYNDYEIAIIDLDFKKLFFSKMTRSEIFEILYEFLHKVRVNGYVIIPESTYSHVPYQSQGIEILLRLAGYSIQNPTMSLRHLIYAKRIQ
ncbi:MAG: ATP-grasp domain-containing protein [Bacilli bacterium]|nr:ATP-grasp domain-containing protein [Bacilli bacterium]